jgi:hypothetical protein
MRYSTSSSKVMASILEVFAGVSTSIVGVVDLASVFCSWAKKGRFMLRLVEELETLPWVFLDADGANAEQDEAARTAAAVVERSFILTCYWRISRNE